MHPDFENKLSNIKIKPASQDYTAKAHRLLNDMKRDKGKFNWGYILGACPRTKNLLRKSWICTICRKTSKNSPKSSFPSLRFLFSDKLLALGLILSMALNWYQYLQPVKINAPQPLLAKNSNAQKTTNSYSMIQGALVPYGETRDITIILEY